ncbi:MAG: hypothetical protein IJ390_08220 [Lachnospiraceae bacterium]|nr:hypothetical protein [Lachnospiraceae bacterium]
MNFTFDYKIEKEVLENYLSRAVTAANLFATATLEDDLRVIQKLGIKFLGRASGIWYMVQDDDEHFAQSKYLADRVHEQDPEIILQACIFEMITQNIETVRIPDQVQAAFGFEPTDRCFRLEDTLFGEEPADFSNLREEKSKRGGIPDLSRTETQMWFYYRATRYIDCGFEALHMGQLHLYTANDRGMKKTAELFAKIRAYAAMHARRHLVLMDAHSHGVVIGGKSLLDYNAMPFTSKPIMEAEGKKLALVREGYSEGGENPSGWCAETMPYLMEYDNWGGKMVDDINACPREKLARIDWWGYDQIGWFANQSKADREHFLEYTYNWVEINNPNAYFEVPFRRMLSDAAVPVKRADNQKEDLQRDYQLNNPSADCPMGFGEEDMVAALWKRGHKLRKLAANPQHLIRYGACQEVEPETGMKLPELIVAYGGFQPYVGAAYNDSNSSITRLYYIGDQTYSLSVVIPFAGTYDFSISTYGTLSAVYNRDRFARSGSGPKARFTTEKDNSVVRFSYRFLDNLVKVEVIRWEDDVQDYVIREQKLKD